MATDRCNISDQLPKLYLFDSLNRTMCEGDMGHIGHRRSQEFVLEGLTSEAPKVPRSRRRRRRKRRVWGGGSL